MDDDFCARLCFDVHVAAGMVDMAMGVDDVFNPDLSSLGRRYDPVRIRRRIDDERIAAFFITHQVGENRHLTDLPLLDEHVPSLFRGNGRYPLRPPRTITIPTKLTGCSYHFFVSQVNGIHVLLQSGL